MYCHILPRNHLKLQRLIKRDYFTQSSGLWCSNSKADAIKNVHEKNQKEIGATKKQIINAEESIAIKEEVLYHGATKLGEKKDVTCKLPNYYSPKYTEAAWYEWWEKEGYFDPDYVKNDGSKEKFVICLPPPNVTGSLHLGHALGNSIQDAIVRWHRMCGREVLWNPGCDHAGIATQTVVEKRLMKTKGTSRLQLGREKFLKKVWEWKTNKGVEIYDQMRKLGCSLDWSRDVFTLDPKLNHAVNEAFIRLHDEGLIYRKKKMINWSCQLLSVISDIEVNTIELSGRTVITPQKCNIPVPFGVLHYFAYPLENGGGELVVATTRPETILGDTAIAVNPSDKRYKHLHGQQVVHPLCLDRKLPIICDEFVQKDFGTGAVKITPSHDADDYEVGLKHGLDFIEVINDKGFMTNVSKKYQGVHRFEARIIIINQLKELGLYKTGKDHAMSLPVCSRSNDIIEPKLKDQWFLDTTDMAQNAVQAVRSGELELIPSNYEKHWFQWLAESKGKQWCISRQLWWGHRIPAFKVNTRSRPEETSWVSAHNHDDALNKAATKLGVDTCDIEVTQDEDVLDTWFSSAIYPFSIFGWPEKTTELERFYPNDLLETASDIMFFWVARMVMMGQKLTGVIPFKQVLFHSILRDAKGKKMSKSLGNVVDPMVFIQGTSINDLVNKTEKTSVSAKQGNTDNYELKSIDTIRKSIPEDIKAFGADAVRFTLASYNYKAVYTNFDANQISNNNRFCNKIWHSFRYVMDSIREDFVPIESTDIQINDIKCPTDIWILSRLSTLIETCNSAFKTYDLNIATQALFSFIWKDFCHLYLENSKGILSEKSNNTERLKYNIDDPQVMLTKQILYICLETSLKLLHPFMPFITEELYQRLPTAADMERKSLCITAYPQVKEYPWRDEHVEEEMEVVRNIITQMLSARTLFNLTRAKPTTIIITPDEHSRNAVEKYVPQLELLGRSSEVAVSSSDSTKSGWYCVDIEAGNKLLMDVKEHVNVNNLSSTLPRRQRKLCNKIKQLRREIKYIKENAPDCEEEKLKESEPKEEKLMTMKEMTMISREEKLKEMEQNLSRLDSAVNLLKQL